MPWCAIYTKVRSLGFGSMEFFFARSLCAVVFDKGVGGAMHFCLFYLAVLLDWRKRCAGDIVVAYGHIRRATQLPSEAARHCVHSGVGVRRRFGDRLPDIGDKDAVVAFINRVGD